MQNPLVDRLRCNPTGIAGLYLRKVRLVEQVSETFALVKTSYLQGVAEKPKLWDNQDSLGG